MSGVTSPLQSSRSGRGSEPAGSVSSKAGPGLKKSEGGFSSLPHMKIEKSESRISSGRSQVRPSSTGEVSLSSARSGTSSLSKNLMTSPYAVSLSARYNDSKPHLSARMTPGYLSARGLARPMSSPNRVESVETGLPPQIAIEAPKEINMVEEGVSNVEQTETEKDVPEDAVSDDPVKVDEIAREDIPALNNPSEAESCLAAHICVQEDADKQDSMLVPELDGHSDTEMALEVENLFGINPCEQITVTEEGNDKQESEDVLNLNACEQAEPINLLETQNSHPEADDMFEIDAREEEIDLIEPIDLLKAGKLEQEAEDTSDIDVCEPKKVTEEPKHTTETQNYQEQYGDLFEMNACEQDMIFAETTNLIETQNLNQEANDMFDIDAREEEMDLGEEFIAPEREIYPTGLVASGKAQETVLLVITNESLEADLNCEILQAVDRPCTPPLTPNSFVFCTHSTLIASIPEEGSMPAEAAQPVTVDCQSPQEPTATPVDDAAPLVSQSELENSFNRALQVSLELQVEKKKKSFWWRRLFCFAC